MNNIGGRPPEWDLEELAKELIEWSYKSDSLNLIGFSSPKRMSVTKLPDFAVKNSKFREALILAKENIGINRFKAASLNQMPEKFYTRCEGMYDPLYHKYDRDEKIFESSLRKDEEGNKPTQITVKVQHDGLGSGLNISAETLPITDNQSSQ